MLEPYRIEVPEGSTPALKSILEALDHLSRQLYLLTEEIERLRLLK